MRGLQSILFATAIGILAFIAAPLLFRLYVIHPYKIPASSMSPTLLVGDHIFVNKLSYRNQTIQRGDIVVFRFPEDRTVDFVKRVVGLPGETISINGNTVYINDSPIEEDYALYVGKSPKEAYEPFLIPVDCVFMLGDNRNNSYDSRFWGPVPIGDVKGKAFRVYWSVDKDNGNRPRGDRFWMKVK